MEIVSFLYRKCSFSSSLLSLHYFQQKQQQQQYRTKKCKKYLFLLLFTIIGMTIVTFYQVRLELTTTSTTATKTLLLLNHNDTDADNLTKNNNNNNTKVIHTYYYYSDVRSDRSGAFVHDMLMAHAFSVHKNQEWELQRQQQQQGRRELNDFDNRTNSTSSHNNHHNVIVRVRYGGACWKNELLWTLSPHKDTIELLTALQLLPSILPLQRCPTGSTGTAVRGGGVKRSFMDRWNERRRQQQQEPQHKQHPNTRISETTTDTTMVTTEQELDELHQQFLQQRPNQQHHVQEEGSKTQYQYHDHHILLNKRMYRDYDSQLFTNEWRQYLQQQQQQQQLQQHTDQTSDYWQRLFNYSHLRYKGNTNRTTPTSRATTTAVTPELLNISQQLTTTTMKRPYRIVVHIRRGDVYPCSAHRYLSNQHYVRLLHEYAFPQLFHQKQQEQEQYNNHHNKNNNTSATTNSSTANPIMTQQNMDLDYEIIIHTESESFESMDDLIYKFHHYYQNDSLTNPERKQQNFHLVVNNELQFRIDSPLWEVWSDIRTADIVILSRSSFSYVPALLNTKGMVVYTPFWHDPPPPPSQLPLVVKEEQQKWDNDWNNNSSNNSSSSTGSSIRSTDHLLSAPSLSPWIIVSQDDLKLDEVDVWKMKEQFCSQYDRKKAIRRKRPSYFRKVLNYFDPLTIPSLSYL